MVLSRIVSGGQTGADRAALDAASAHGVSLGGWVPRGRWAEDGRVPDALVGLRETESADPAERTRRNVADSDGTLIVSHGALRGGTELTRATALKSGKPCLWIDLGARAPELARQHALAWLELHRIRVLNVAGPRASEDADIYDATFAFVSSLLNGSAGGEARREHPRPPLPRHIWIKGASGSGKSTLSRELARRLGLPHVELDELHHGPNWTGASAEQLRARVSSVLDDARGWVVDGNYDSKLGQLVLDRADLIVWIDLPLRTQIARLLRRTATRIWRSELLWNGNRESLKGAIWGAEALFPWAIRTHFRYRRQWPGLLAERSVVRLRSPRQVETWLRTFCAEREQRGPHGLTHPDPAREQALPGAAEPSKDLR